jgi:hypothetical protein
VAGMQQQPMYIGLERPWDHTHQGPSTAGQNDPSAGSVGALAILGAAADGDTPRTLPGKRLIKAGKKNRRREECNSFNTPASSLNIQRRKPRP